LLPPRDIISGGLPFSTLSSQPVDPANLPIQPLPPDAETVTTESKSSKNSMDSYYQLQQELLVTTIVLIAIAFGPIWWFYSIKVALNYFVGACTGVVYLKLLARNVERLGTQEQKVGKSQLAVFIGVIIFATQWEQLQVLPIFLGFLTYKAAILVYTLKTVAKSS
jgi:ATP synthase protein I